MVFSPVGLDLPFCVSASLRGAKDNHGIPCGCHDPMPADHTSCLCHTDDFKDSKNLWSKDSGRCLRVDPRGELFYQDENHLVYLHGSSLGLGI